MSFHRIDLPALEEGRKKHLAKVGIWQERCDRIGKYKSTQTFFLRLNENKRSSQHTTKSCLMALWRFCNWAKMNPDQLTEERAKSLEFKMTDEGRQVAEDRLRKFRQEQEAKGSNPV